MVYNKNIFRYLAKFLDPLAKFNKIILTM